MWPNLQKGVLYTYPIFHLWRVITSFASKLLDWNFRSYYYNDRTVLLPSFKTVGPVEAELHILKFEKLDVCIRPLFANSVTYVTWTGGICLMCKHMPESKYKHNNQIRLHMLHVWQGLWWSTMWSAINHWFSQLQAIITQQNVYHLQQWYYHKYN